MPPVDWDVRIRDQCTCRYCDLCGNGNFDIWLNLTIDHVVPGGGECADNKAVACHVCNSIKRKYHPKGSNLDERIADARRYIREKRESWRQRFEMMMGQIENRN